MGNLTKNELIAQNDELQARIAELESAAERNAPKDDEMLVPTTGKHNFHVSYVELYTPQRGVSNLVFHIDKPVVLYKKDADDNTILMETTEVKVMRPAIIEAMAKGKMPYFSPLFSLTKGRLTGDLTSALSESDITFNFTPYNAGDPYIKKDGTEGHYEHDGVHVDIEFAQLAMASIQIAIMAIKIANKKVL